MAFRRKFKKRPIRRRGFKPKRSFKSRRRGSGISRPMRIGYRM